MIYLKIFYFILLFAGIFAENSICNEKKRLKNSRECCEQPKLITNTIIEKCRRRMNDIYQEQLFGDLAPELDENDVQTEQYDAQIPKKPNMFESISNNVKREARTNGRHNPFDLNEYGDSDEKIFEYRDKYKQSDSSSESREHHRSKHHKCHHRHHHDRHHKDLSSSESNSLENISSENVPHRRHHRHRHRHHSCHRHHHRRHNCHRRHNNQFHENRIFKIKKYSCFMECVINETGIISNNSLNLDKFNRYLTDELKLNDDYLTIVTDAFETCVQNVAEMRKKIHELPVLPLIPPIMLQQGHETNMDKMPKCKSWSSYIFMCANAQTFINCPSKNFKNDDIECTNTKEFMKLCPKQTSRILIGEKYFPY